MTATRRDFAACLAALGAMPFWPRDAVAQARRDALVVAFPRAVRTLDGNFANLRENDILGLLVDDALYAVDPDTAQPVPLVAKAHRFVDDRTLEVDLRDDVRFHDGAILTAEDVVYTYTYILNEKGKSDYTSRFDRWLASVEARGAHGVTFRLKQPYAMALYDFAMYSKLRRKGTYDDASKPDGVNPEAQTLSLNGTGPYRVTAFRPGQQITLERFAGYRAGGPKGAPPLRTITIRIIPDWSTQAAEVMSGGVHWTFGMPTEIAEGAAASGAAQLLSGPSMRTFYVSMDATGRTPGAEPLKDVRVRQALIHALDRDTIVRELLKGSAKVLHTACVPVQFGCSEEGVKRYGFDPARARALLAEAGHANGFDIEFWAAIDRPRCEAIVAQWRAVGVRATLRFVQSATLTQARREQKIALEYASSGSFGIPDAGAILPDRLGPGSGRNYSGDEELSKTILASVSTYDPATRARLMSEALKRIADQAYWVPLWTDAQNFLMAPQLAYSQPGDGMARLYTARWR